MRLQNTLKQTQTQKQTISQKQRYALRILAMSDIQLQKEMASLIEENPLLDYDETQFHKDDIFERASQIIGTSETLKDVLYLQLHTRDADIAYDLAEYLIESLDTNGYLSADLPTYEDEDVFEDTLAFLQTFEPAGVFARNLQECLLIQLCTINDPASKLAILMINECLDLLSQHQYNQIATTLQVSMEEIKAALTLIRSLNPLPGAQYYSDAFVPSCDANITVQEETIHITMCSTSQQVKLNTMYQNIQDEVALAYVQKATKQAEVFISCLNRRNETLSKILTCICEVQRDFFLSHGELKPLSLAEVASAINVHESTVSRAISQKAVVFEEHHYPIKFFFPVGLESGQSSSQIHHRIRELIAQEPPQKPYSDQKIADLLKAESIVISRRTITKYREQLQIGAAPQRKLQKQL